MKKTICVFLLMASVGALSVAGAQPAAAAAAPSGPKTHVLFMGLDLDWEQGRQYHRVRAVRGRTAVVRVDGKEQSVKMGGDNNIFKVVNSLKLGKATVRLDQVKLDRFYTPGNDPQKRFMEAFAVSTAAMDEGMVARQQAMQGQYFLTIVHDDTKPELDPDYAAKVQAGSENQFALDIMNIDTMRTFSQTTMMPQVTLLGPKLPDPKLAAVTLAPLEIKETDVTVTEKPAGSAVSTAQPSAAPAGATPAVPTSGAAVAGAPAAEPLPSKISRSTAVEAKSPLAQAGEPAVITDSQGEWFDALDLKFEVSAEKPLADPYVVVVLNYIDPAEPREPRQWVHAQQLESVGPTPRLVRLRQGGFPMGFMPKQPRIHIYDRGREVATSSARGTALTRDEAMEYLLIEYLATNKKATLAASPIVPSFPEDLAARMQATRFPKEVFVQVNADGMPVEMFADAGRRRRIEDPAVRATIADVRFHPALEKGKPIEAMARLTFSEAAR